MTLGFKDVLFIDGVSHQMEVTDIKDCVINGFRFDDRLFVPAVDISAVKTLHSELDNNLKFKPLGECPGVLLSASDASLRVCSKCGVSKPVSSFYGKKHQCKDCISKYNKEYHGTQTKTPEPVYTDRFSLKKEEPSSEPIPPDEPAAETGLSADTEGVSKFQATYDHVEKSLLEKRPVDFTVLEVSNIVMIFYKNRFHQTLITGQPYALDILKQLIKVGVLTRERRKPGGPFFYNLVNKQKEAISVEPAQPVTMEKASEEVTPVKKTLGWTRERDETLRKRFPELGVSGIYDKSIFPGFSMTEIRKRCQDLKLIDEYGLTIKWMMKKKHGVVKKNGKTGNI